jgi:ABC-2 type transport system permease protein
MTTAVHANRYRLVDLVRSEWTKFTSVRSSRWTLAAFAVLTVSRGVAVSAASGAHWSRLSPSARASFDPTNMSLAGLAFGELAIGVLGVLVMSGEYSSGSITSTLSAVPRRPFVLAAKFVMFAAVAFVAGEVVTIATFLAGQAAMGDAPHASLLHADVARAVLESGAFLTLIGLLGLGLGTIIRHSAGAIAALVGVVLVLPIVSVALPGNVVRFMPEDVLASSVAAVHHSAGELTPWVGFAAVAAYAAAALLAGGIALVVRDA